MADAELEEVTLTCDFDGCGAEVTGNASGVGSATWKLGTHKYQVHGVRNPNGKAAKGKKPDPPPSQPTGVAVVREIGSGAKGTGKGVPSASDLANGLGRGVQILSIVAASYAAETDDGLSTEAQRDALVRELSLSPRASIDIMEPLANAFQGTKVNKRYGRQIVDNVDALASVGELGKLAFTWRRYFRLREERRHVPLPDGTVYIPPPPNQTPPPASAQAPPPPGPAPAPPAQPTAEGYTPPAEGAMPAPAPSPAEPALAQQPAAAVVLHDVMGNVVPPMEGRVLSRDDVEQMRRARG